MKKIILIAAIGLFFSQCTQAGNKSDAVSANQQSEQTVIHIDKSQFLKEIYNYELNSNVVIYRGKKPCIVDFYADWCGPCRMQTPIFEDLEKEFKEAGMDVNLPRDIPTRGELNRHIGQQVEKALTPMTQPVKEVLPLSSLLPAAEKTVYGLNEQVSLPELKLEVTAKLDTGAETASLSARDISRFKRNGKTWVRFYLAIDNSHAHPIERPLARVGLLSNRVVDVWALATAAFLAVGLYVPGIGARLKLVPLPLGTVAVLTLVIVLWMLLLEGRKYLRLRATRRSPAEARGA